MNDYNSPERRAYRRSIITGMLWAFWKPVLIGWGIFAVVVAVVLALVKW